MKQSKLMIERTYEFYSDLIRQGKVAMMVDDDIELAQFVHYLSNHKRMRDALNVLNDRVCSCWVDSRTVDSSDCIPFANGSKAEAMCR
jgi:hypothetical protein